jgi:hypothetical protein
MATRILPRRKDFWTEFRYAAKASFADSNLPKCFVMIESKLTRFSPQMS